MIKLDDKFTEQFSPNEQLVMLRLLVGADEDGMVEITTRAFAESCGMTRWQLGTIFKNLSQNGEIEITVSEKTQPKSQPKGTPKSTFVTICNFETYRIGKKKTNQNIHQNTNQNKTSVSQKREAIKEREHEFGMSLIPYMEKYSKEMIRAFFNYWSEIDQSGTKMRFEREKTWETSKRLMTWANRDRPTSKSSVILNSSEMNYDKEKEW